MIMAVIFFIGSATSECWGKRGALSWSREEAVDDGPDASFIVATSHRYVSFMPHVLAHTLSLDGPARPLPVHGRVVASFLPLTGITVLGPLAGLDLIIIVLLLGLLISLLLIG